jgi:predicted O-methyltransferase YrrM
MLFFVCVAANGIFAKTPDEYLKGKIAPTSSRYKTVVRALDLMERFGVRTIVETGTSRGGDCHFCDDGGSTIIFAQWAQDHGAEVFSIDVSQKNLANAKAAVIKYVSEEQLAVQYVWSDSVSYLKRFDRQIDFLYLDSYDYDARNPAPSQKHHLREIQAAYPFLGKNSIVMIDDCDLPGGGKGKMVIEFLLQRGWKIIDKQYQAILMRE